MKLSLAIIALVAIQYHSIAQAPKAVKYFEWYQQSYEIEDATFAHSDSEIAFALRFYIPDGHSAERREKYVDSLLHVATIQKRLGDPTVAILNLKTKELTKVDYGWSPNFSTDDTRLAYSFQTIPLAGKRVLANTLAGNSIKVYNIATGQSAVIASPDHSFLLDPVFVDTNNIIYKIGDAVNGDFGGGIAFEKINTATNKTETTFGAKRNFGLFNLIGDIYKYDSAFYFTVYVPQDSATWMANHYHHLLLNSAGVAHDFGTGRFRSLEGKFAIASDGGVIFLDDDHDLIADKNILYKYFGQKIVYKKVIKFNYNNALLSPNGKLMLYHTGNAEFYLLNTDNFEKSRLTLPAVEIYGVAWSDDSKKLAIIQPHQGLADTDVISLFYVQ